MSKIAFFQEQASGVEHEVTLPCVIGRGAEADLTIMDTTVSQRHAVVEEIGGRIWISDMGSTNGVYVNFTRIGEKTPLQAGDVIRLGEQTLVLSLREEELPDYTVILPPLDPEQEPTPDVRRLRFIYDLTSEMAVNQDMDTLGEKIAGRLRSLFAQDRVYIALFQDDGSLTPVFTKSSEPLVPVSRSIINRMFQTGESFLLDDALREESFREQEASSPSAYGRLYASPSSITGRLFPASSISTRGSRALTAKRISSSSGAFGSSLPRS